MTIQTSQNSVVFQGNNVTNVFDIPFVMDAASFIIVLYTNSSGVITAIPPTQYNVSINLPTTGMIWGIGGTLQYPISGSSIAIGTSINVIRLLPLQQNTNLTNPGNFYPQTVEAALDTLEMQIQQVNARTGQIRGIWQPNTLYNYGDIVQDGSYGLDSLNYYLCAQTNTSSSSWVNDLSAGYWSLALPATIPVTPLPLSIANGGTGASSTITALNNLGGISLAGNNIYTGTNNFTGGSIQVSTRPEGDTSTFAASTYFVNGTALTLANNTTAVTQSNGDSSTNVATDQFVQNMLDYKGCVFENLLPNTQWQIFSLLAYITKMNSQGTGTQGSISVSSYNTGSNTVTFNTSSTGQLKVGDIVNCTVGETNLKVAPMRVSAVIANTSFTANLPYFLTASSSGTTTIFPISVGDTAGNTGYGPDGWQKANTLLIWRDDFSINKKVGSLYQLGLRKGSASSEGIGAVFDLGAGNVPPGAVAKFQGRTVVFGAWVYQKVQSGSGTWNLSINDSFGQTFSANGTGASLAGYQWLEVSATINANAAYVIFTVNTNGADNDVYYLSQPMAAFGTSLGTGNYIQNPGEQIQFMTHINAPTLAPFVRTMPTTQYPVGSGYYGYLMDLEALTFTQIARTCRTILMGQELLTSTVGGEVTDFTVTQGTTYATFGPTNITQVAGVNTSVQGILALDSNGYYVMASAGASASGLVVTDLTVDFDGARLC